MLSVELISDFAALAPLLPEWLELEAQLTTRVPSKTPGWTLTWWRHFQRVGLKARDSLHVYALRDETGRLVGLAPMMLTHRPGYGPIHTRELQFIGADPYVTQLRGALALPGRLGEVVDTLADYIAAEGSCDWVQWRGLPAGHSFAGNGADRGDAFLSETALSDIDLVLPLGQPWEAFRDALPKRTRKVLRKCYNDLKAEAIAYSIRVVTAPEDVPAALDVFLQQHQSRAEADGVKPHPNVFSTRESRAFLADICRHEASRGALRLFQLRLADEVAATRLGFLLGDQLYLYFSGYDMKWARLGVMTTLIAEIIQWAIANNVNLINLSSGTDRSKTRWLPQSIELSGGYTYARALKSRIAFMTMHRLRGTKPATAVEASEPAEDCREAG
ncbi:MAG: GNAT family N-acetyltransferase [Ancalomicrobiaceae bacterium]|nr:GNAT family N-acetyltransferase [Ancalomicrobiaceae bacterium]